MDYLFELIIINLQMRVYLHANCQFSSPGNHAGTERVIMQDRGYDEYCAIGITAPHPNI